MIDINAVVAWLSVAAGVVAGTVGGLFFHHAHWLGGYGSWRRRLVRLGHISFFGIGFLNLGYSLTINALHWSRPPAAASDALAAAAVLMPITCYLAAWRASLRHLFAVPVLCVLAGVGGLLLRRAMP